MILIAHRGASGAAPENTAAAIRLALKAGADMIELDVQLTRDHRLVIFHDERLERTTNGRGVLSRWRYRDVARFDAGSWCARRFAGERILLVSQALRLIPPPYWINLELKRTTQTRWLIPRLLRCLQWTRTTSRVLVSSFDGSLIARLRQRAPHLATALVCRQHPFQHLRRAVRLGCAALHPHQTTVSPRLVDQAHAAGLQVYAWPVDHLSQARRLARMGLDGVFTNVPAILRAAERR